MGSKPSSISSKQLVFILIGLQIGTGILSLPRLASQNAAQDAWIVVIVGALVPLVSLFLIEHVLRWFPEKDFVALTQLLFGKILGCLLILLLLLYIIVFQSIVIRLFTEITSLVLLPRTPLMVINFMMVVAVVYIAAKGVRVVGRLNELLFYILLFFFALLIIPAAITPTYTNLLPVGGSGVVNIATDVVQTSFAYAGVELLLVYYFWVERKNEVRKAGILAVIITMSLYLFVTVLCLLVFSADTLQQIVWPVHTLLKVTKIGVIERMEIFFLSIWLALGARPAINSICAAAYSITRLLSCDENTWYPRMVFCLGLLIFLGAGVPDDFLSVLKYAQLMGYTFYLVGLGYPLLYFMTVFFRRKELKSH